MILMMVVLFAIMYFFMIRPQNKKQKEIEKFRSALSVGQDVVTIGGIYGTVRSIDEAENTVTLEVATGVKIKFAKSAINPLAEKTQSAPVALAPPPNDDRFYRHKTDNQGLLFPNVGQAGFDFSVFSLSLHRLLVFPGPQ